jgi:hypothetical protein
MARTLSFLMVAGFLAATGCKTITEELPTTATAPPAAVPQVNVPVPVVVTPVQLPQPQSPAPAPNPNSPSPSSTPLPEGEGDGGPDIPDNRNPVARVQAKVFFVECGGGAVPGSGSEAPVGCRVHLDATPKDAGGRPTQAKGRPQWSYTDTSAIDIAGNSPFNPVLTVKKTGSTTASCTIDGVRSNDVSIRFVP